MSMYTYFQKEMRDLHLPPGSCLKEREIEKANKLVKIAMDQKKVSPTRIMIRCGCVTNCAHAINSPKLISPTAGLCIFANFSLRQ